MKDSLIALAGVLLIAHGTLALAASSVDLSVKGAITPSACTPSLSNGGLVDYGKISAQDLDPTGVTELPRTLFKLAVNCEGSSLFALDAQDNRSSIAGPAISFVLGRISPTNWIATYFLTMENVVTDDPTAYPIYSLDNGSTWIYNSERQVPANTLSAFGNQTSGIRAPVPLTDVALDLIVQPYIFPKSQIPAGETIPLDGSATFELRYL
ncbi:DUF1120 domain-containing protein [Pseudomonas tolaasii]|uniref:DUF1120 domain-containing protein n=2 Tax=Pseudomonas tolaasii TaxID=29442 RepID=A0A7Y8ATY7_PSETO|nr:DUF1120 domain-containing protein [Pseudomonas tolaasii]ARB26343.1 hypothetical protein B5P22_03270 [Pseudomonas tolaasii]KAB0476180.1 DUF1120 domain-containing protein [Pseudomonas tolaasii]MBW4794862.1 DUF1120 domain-containing protein [Pseudomonas tolaasii]MBY8939625.1 DUF1120 domain-containing protein [Pseudomonas tolaasii]NVZ46331.1 DUF1120 domain-containing protein [Pseudomonas tolaasii]